MNLTIQSSGALALGILTLAAWAGDDGANSGKAASSNTNSAMYRVTMVQRTIRAMNYGHRELPTQIGFKGTMLSPESKGRASVRAKAGVVEVNARLEKLGPPSRFGAQFLTYVLWAVSPEGQTQRLAELQTNHNYTSKIRVTVPMQTFGLIVTAEPYFAVARPGPVLVLENAARPDTIGKVEEVEAKYELLPGSQEYTFDVDAARRSEQANAPLVSVAEYDALSAIYQARYAIQLAKEDGVNGAAGDTLRKAEMLLQQAEAVTDRKKGSKQIVMLARQASQTAQDARSIAEARSTGEK